MLPLLDHSWDLSPDEATRLQQSLAHNVVGHDALSTVTYIAGVDVAYHQESDMTVGAIVVLDAQSLDLVDIALASGVAQFPYLPGLFSFRELPVLIDAMAQVNVVPDLIVCDGHGIAHPQRFGLACHLGLLYDIPTIGCAKTRLIGSHDAPDIKRGSSAELREDNETIGAALRTQTGTRPVYISTGHRISLATACDWILRVSPRHRLPETTRAADHAVKMAMKKIRT